MLLGRATEQLSAHRFDDEHASRGSADDVSLHSGRRHTPVLRLACAEADDDDERGALLSPSWRTAYLAASMQELAFHASQRLPPYAKPSSATSARGPPAIDS
jgi:hypothetical protein